MTTTDLNVWLWDSCQFSETGGVRATGIRRNAHMHIHDHFLINANGMTVEMVMDAIEGDRWFGTDAAFWNRMRRVPE